MRQFTFKPFNAATQASATTSAAVDAEQLYNASWIAVFTDGAAAGALKVQASNDPPPAGNMAPFTPTNWVDIASATVTVAAGAASMIPLTNISYRWVRAVWTTSGGAGTMTVFMNAQGF